MSSNPFESFRYGSDSSKEHVVVTAKSGPPIRVGAPSRGQPPLCSVCEFMETTPGQALCSVCTAHRSKKRRQEFNTMEFLMEQEDLRNFSQMNTKIACSPSAERPDFMWVLPDRVVLLEVDEHQHKYSTSATCEREREYRIADSLRREQKHIVLVRFNPDQKNVSPWKMYDTLGKAVRDAFVTDDCRFAEDGILRRYIGYDRGRVRSIEREYSISQRGMMQESLDLRHMGSAPIVPKPSDEEEAWFAEFKRLMKSTIITRFTPSECIDRLYLQ